MVPWVILTLSQPLGLELDSVAVFVAGADAAGSGAGAALSGLGWLHAPRSTAAASGASRWRAGLLVRSVGDGTGRSAVAPSS
ncbi:hypothetical protein SynMEDNS5_00952 [Synechococcus sp. MEDNS5]|nr:hypothetical protein SynMEDNS5_00952 [Synechococcus sp. MEDNS5]